MENCARLNTFLILLENTRWYLARMSAITQCCPKDRRKYHLPAHFRFLGSVRVPSLRNIAVYFTQISCTDFSQKGEGGSVAGPSIPKKFQKSISREFHLLFASIHREAIFRHISLSFYYLFFNFFPTFLFIFANIISINYVEDSRPFLRLHLWML